jgi:exonuclease VII large subunit
MATNKNFEWTAEITSAYKNKYKGQQIVFTDSPNRYLDFEAPTYKKAVEFAQKKADEIIADFNSKSATKSKKYFRDNERINPQVRVYLSRDYLKKWIKYADDSVEDATEILNGFIKKVFPNYAKTNNFLLLIPSYESGEITVKGFEEVYSSFLPYAVKDGLTIADLKPYWNAVLERTALRYMNLKQEEFINADNRVMKKLETAYANIRNKLSTNTQNRFDGMHRYLNHSEQLQEERLKKRRAYNQKQNFAFEDGGVIGGFNYSIGGL